MPSFVSQYPIRTISPCQSSPEPELEELQHIPSIADPGVSSPSSKLYHSCREITTQNLGNNFCTRVFVMLFDLEAPVEWVTGRSEKPVLHWYDEYLPFCEGVDCRPLLADFKLSTQRIGVQTDGGLQILLPQTDGDNVEWVRSYYEIALKVATPSPSIFLSTPLLCNSI